MKRNSLLTRLFAALVLAAIGPALQAAPAETSAGGFASAESAAARRASADDLMARLLEAGGTQPADIPRYQSRLHSLAAELAASLQFAGDERQKAVAIHAFIHRRILRGPFLASGINLADVLDGGPYNCATTTALFLALAAGLNVQAHAASVPGHVWCRVESERGLVEVETTCRNWFEILTRDPARHTPASRALVAAHRRRASHARTLDAAGLVAVFHFNRGVKRLDEGDLPAAAGDYLAALRCDPDCVAAHSNLLVTLNQWSLALAMSGQRQLSLAVLRQGLVLAVDYEPFRANYRWLTREQNETF